MRSRSSRRVAAALALAVPLSVFVAGSALAAPGGLSTASVKGAGTPAELPWMNTALTPEQRSELLIDAMTLDQKLQQMTGSYPEILPDLPECFGARHVTGIAALSIPTLRITNGPVGVGQNDCVDPALADGPNPYAAYTDPSSATATALPSATTVAASFDPLVASRFGDVIGTEMNNLALHVFEAPGMNMARLPILGRNFEYFGEDPYLSGTMAVAEVKAVQDHGLIAMAKHFVANEQETNRMTIQETVGERTLHELYLLPFEMTVKDGDVSSVMCAYNYVNGTSSCENGDILNGVLRDQWGFKGYVQSDFFATKSTVDTLLGGMDLMMPLPQQWAPQLLTAALDAGDIAVSDIDTALDRRYTQMFKRGIFDRPLVQTPIDFVSGGEKARDIGTSGAVLLQNNGALPIASDVQKVVVIGKASQIYAQQAVAGGSVVGKPMGSGGGSSDVVPNYTVSPVEGLRNVLATLGNSTADVELILVDDENKAATLDGEDISFDAALQEARDADSVIVMAGTIAEEGADRATFSDESGRTRTDIGDNLDWYAKLPNRIATVDGPNAAGNSHTVAMISAIMKAAPAMEDKTALVLKDNAGVEMPPELVGASGPAILEAWFPGQEDGNIVADVLFGVKNPSGKSPFTYPQAGKGFLDSISTRQFPGDMIDDKQTVEYTEGLDMGYRWYDAQNVEPAFAFGHGLSYTDFEISKLVVTPKTSDGSHPITVRFQIKNTGDVAGAEVGQVYLALPSGAGNEPAKRLVGFDKVTLEPGEKKTVKVTIDPASSNHPLGVWDSAADGWSTAEGDYTVYVGNASDNTPLQSTITVRTPKGHR